MRLWGPCVCVRVRVCVSMQAPLSVLVPLLETWLHAAPSAQLVVKNRALYCAVAAKERAHTQHTQTQGQQDSTGAQQQAQGRQAPAAAVVAGAPTAAAASQAASQPHSHAATDTQPQHSQGTNNNPHVITDTILSGSLEEVLSLLVGAVSIKDLHSTTTQRTGAAIQITSGSCDVSTSGSSSGAQTSQKASDNGHVAGTDTGIPTSANNGSKGGHMAGTDTGQKPTGPGGDLRERLLRLLDVCETFHDPEYATSGPLVWLDGPKTKPAAGFVWGRQKDSSKSVAWLLTAYAYMHRVSQSA